MKKMLSFYPGPSKVDPELSSYLMEAHASGILSNNHRSKPFMDLMENCIKTIKKQLDIPKNYEVLFTSSATECWEITAQSYLGKKFLHIYNGSFGQKWFQYNQKINQHVTAHEYSIQKSISLNHLKKIDAQNADVLCLTSCETSNTTKVHQKTFQKIRSRYKDALLFIDATSSMSGVRLDWLSGDIWYASVQKCFGLPSGLGVMIVSPKALQEANANDFHYNNILSIYNNQQKRQTTHTPNTLGIYLLEKVLSNRKEIKSVENHTKKKMLQLKKALKRLGYNFLINTNKVQSETVIGIISSKEQISLIKERALKEEITLGNGYGKWKDTSLRIANFPSHSYEDIERLISFFQGLEKCKNN
ncbi:aminotransferase class V-fold PLP-dependent enzyme [Flammeovirga sp. SubArs3]|uniref:aminotransferase class V-fold PLP-dependent enzyme n=1 Tax=Flammeovirga sp. SubArs3 TaxID=2995316 RepID=UPI00248D0E17|nr:aminotransferase class V-fold PLP-dependent enzyme [Flammeovirga sp. SubArs3]